LGSEQEGVPNSKAAPRVIEYPRDGVVLGTGWNSPGEQKAPSVCISFGQKDDTGEDTFLDLTNISDDSGLMQQLNLSASIAFSYGIASGSTKVRYARQVQISDDSDYFVVFAQVLNGAHFVIPRALVGTQNSSQQNKLIKPGQLDVSSSSLDGTQIDLLPNYAKLAKSDLARFLSVCGDSFVSAMHDGAELSARLQLSIHNVKEKETVAAELDGSYAGAKFSATAESTLERYNNSNQLKILYHKSGGSGDPVATDKAGLLSAIKGLATSAKESARPFLITIQGYEALPSWPKAVAGSKFSNLQVLYDQYWKLKTLFDQADYIKRHPDDFILDRGVTSHGIEELQDRLKSILDSIEKTAKACSTSAKAGACALSTEDSTSDYEFRTHFPLRRSTFELGARLDSERASLPNLQAQLADQKKHRALVAAFAPHSTGQIDQQINAIQTQLTATQQSITSDEAAYAGALKLAIADQWIHFPASTRCRQALHSSGCINNEEQGKWVAKIVTQ
jgi:hypothetical protein